jgi:hypothetical protein
MIKLVLTLLSSVVVSMAFSQAGAFSSPAGYTAGESFGNRAYKEKADNSVEGNPMLFDDWRAGEVILKNDEKYVLGKINMDASADKFLYSKNDTVFEFSDNVKEIKIYSQDHSDNAASDMVFRNDIFPTAGDFVQVLAAGKITIYQEYDKKPEGENYSNGIVNNSRKYVLHTTQSALVNKKIVPVKFSSSTLDELTSDKKDQVEAYVKENKLKPKKEDDFLKAINYYNSISTATP